jgi:hypothetical protein
MNTPAFQFYPGDWLKDPCLAQCSLATKGAWIELLAHMHESETPGKLEGTYLNFARMCRCTEEEIKAAILELQETKTATVIIGSNAESQKVTQRSNVKVTVINRRMFKAFKDKQDAARRQSEFRARKREVTQESQQSNEDITSPSSTSTSTSTSKIGNTNSCPELEKISSEQQAKNDPPVITIPLNTGEEYPIPQSLVQEFERLYPSVDVMQGLRAIRGWNLTNVTHRKTRGGILRHINGWLAKAQNGGSNGQRHNGHYYSGREARRQSYRETIRNGIRAAKDGDTSLN